MDESTSLWYSDYDAPNYDRDWGARLPHDVTSAGPGSERLSADVAIIHTTREQLLVQGAMASAAIPAVFPARSFFDGAIDHGHYVDGGVRDAVPVEAVRSIDGAASVVSVAASPLEITDPFSEIKVRRLYATAPILELVSRGVVDTVLSEVERNDLALLDTEFPHLSIAPHFEVHGTAEIDPGSLRINFAYGYMRAFDEFKLRAGEVESGDRPGLLRSADQITQDRMFAFWAERTAFNYLALDRDAVLDRIQQLDPNSGDADIAREALDGLTVAVSVPLDRSFPRRDLPLIRMIRGYLLSQAPRVGVIDDPTALSIAVPIDRVVFDPGSLAWVRELKGRVAAAALERVERFGPEAFPRRLNPEQSVPGWWESWERHYGRGALLHLASLDQPQLLLQGEHTLEEPANSIVMSALAGLDIRIVSVAQEPPVAPPSFPPTIRADLVA